VELTAGERLAIARAGLERLRAERAAAGDRKRAAETQFGELDAKLQGLFREQDLHGADLGLAVRSVMEQRAEAARQVSAASTDAVDLDRRIAVVRDELPRLEASALQDELAATVAAGAAVARRYRAAVGAMLEAAVELQGELGRCERLAGQIFTKGDEPRHKLAAHIIEGADLDQVLRVARVNNFDPAAVDAAAAHLWGRWRI
jgi:uncharacterized small protein (DUF1192 family)